MEDLIAKHDEMASQYQEGPTTLRDEIRWRHASLETAAIRAMGPNARRDFLGFAGFTVAIVLTAVLVCFELRHPQAPVSGAPFHPSPS